MTGLADQRRIGRHVGSARGWQSPAKWPQCFSPMVLALGLFSCSQPGRAPAREEPAVATAETMSPATPEVAGEGETAALGESAVRVLAEAFASVGLETAVKGNAVSVGGTEIAVAVTEAETMQRGDQHIAVLELHVAIDGAQIAALAAGVVGVDPTAEGAKQTAVREWAAQYGAPIAFALAAKLGATRQPNATDGIAAYYSKMEIPSGDLFFGPPGLRGGVKDPSVFVARDFIETIAQRVVPRLESDDEYRSANIQLVVEGIRISRGECRVNGEVSDALLADLGALTWPDGDPTYMYKQFFVIVGRR